MSKTDMINETVLQSRIKALFEYDSKDGNLRNKTSRSAKAQPGELAGNVNKANGYRYISVDGVSYRAHRLVWLYHYGRWPKKFLDHINLDRDDNHLENLREASGSQNIANTPPRCKSGLKGVRKSPEGWRSFIMKDGMSKALGTFRTPEEAHFAYCVEAYALYGEYAHSSVLEAIRSRKEA